MGSKERAHIIPRQHAIHKLQHTHDDEKGKKSVNQLGPLRRLGLVVLGEVEDDLIPGLLLC